MTTSTARDATGSLFGGATGSLFEENYLVRTLGRIAQDPETALTELVANAWDAGASLVELKIPEDRGQEMTVADDGHGMSPSQFRSRWMKLAYDRARHQGPHVEFPPERSQLMRRAYGRNGVGRHGLLCFADGYSVETWREPAGAGFEIGTRSHTTPFFIASERVLARAGHGTVLSVTVERHLPDPDRIREILSARFLHDPQFQVRVNGQSVDLAEQGGLIERKGLVVDGRVAAEAFVVDSERVAKSTAYQGIAFWVNGRLVGSTSWVVGSEAVVDGRSRFAKRYSIVVKADDTWLSEIEPDWSKFKTNQKTKALFAAVRDYAQGVNSSLSASLAEESSEDALLRHREEFKELTRLEQAKVATFARVLVGAIPTASQEFLSSAVQALINLERARGGAALLDRLTKLDDADIDGLDRLLGEWSVQDALSVLDEIDHRLAVVAAIEKLSADEGADELHTLHPLVTQARWLFGPEFDSSEFASNVTLRSATETVFSKRLAASEFQNARRRPDIVVLSDATCSIVGSEEFDSANPALARMRNVLIIELKRGRSAIGRDEMTQADGYVQDFLGLGAIDGEPTISAFVVGHDIAPKTTRDKELRDGARRGRVQATTYGQLVRTANQRLFRLKERIPARYEDVSGADLSARIMQTASQAPLL